MKGVSRLINFQRLNLQDYFRSQFPKLLHPLAKAFVLMPNVRRTIFCLPFWVGIIGFMHDKVPILNLFLMLVIVWQSSKLSEKILGEWQAILFIPILILEFWGANIRDWWDSDLLIVLSFLLVFEFLLASKMILKPVIFVLLIFGFLILKNGFPTFDFPDFKIHLIAIFKNLISPIHVFPLIIILIRLIQSKGQFYFSTTHEVARYCFTALIWGVPLTALFSINNISFNLIPIYLIINLLCLKIISDLKLNWLKYGLYFSLILTYLWSIFYSF